MTVKKAGTSVRASVLVEAPIARAFKVFTEEISTWWPPDHHIIEGELAGVVFEPRVVRAWARGPTTQRERR